MRILIATDNWPPRKFGGMAQHAWHTARFLGQRHDVLVLTLREDRRCPTPGGEDFTLEPSLTERFPQRNFRIVRRRARSFKADVVHVCTAGLADDRLARICPVVTRVVGNDFLRPWRGFNLPLRPLLYRLPGKHTRTFIHRHEMRIRKARVIRYLQTSDSVVANSTWTRDRLIESGVQPDRIARVVGGVDTSLFQPASDRASVRKRLGLCDDAAVVMTAANLVPKKGIDTVIRALGQLRHSHAPQYVVVGAGPEGERLRQLASELGVSASVQFVGAKSQAELACYYQAADVYVQASRNAKLGDGSIDVETMGRTYFEAGACRVPVVAARVGGVPDVVGDGENGLIVDDPEDYETLAQAIQRLLGDTQLRNRLGEAGLRRARDEFSWNRVGKRFEDLLSAAAGVPGGN
jgi:glycosyltransferase involved in cell wall biosynthesis